MNYEHKISVIGLGYVGLPLAVEFGKKYETIGFDIDRERVEELESGYDSTLEVTKEELSKSSRLKYTTNINDLTNSNIYIVTVPTPIDEYKQPDLEPLRKASAMLGGVISKGDIVIYESTVYPGVTEDVCVPILEKNSGLIHNQDFFSGYSPERINPGDKEHKVSDILKVTSGSNDNVANIVDELYRSVIIAGTHKASSIKVAEASKVIENVQRDVNIALINELHQIFNKLDIDTNEVIEAAATKWNFMKLKPGLVGGHCISVDPYYLLHKSQEAGYIPDLIRKAREINDFMPSYLAQDFVKQLLKRKINPVDCHVGLLGFTFKENCPDVRNTKVNDLYNILISLGFEVTVYDPWADISEVYREYGIQVKSELDSEYDVAFITVAHNEVIKFANDKLGDKFVYDYKSTLKR